MPLNKKGRVIKPKSAMQKFKANMTRKHNKAFGKPSVSRKRRKNSENNCVH